MNSMDEDAVFAVVLTLPPEQRAAYLDQRCAGDHELRRRVETRLQAQTNLVLPRRSLPHRPRARPSASPSR